MRQRLKIPYSGLFSRRLYFANSQFNSCSRKVISRMEILNHASSHIKCLSRFLFSRIGYINGSKITPYTVIGYLQLKLVRNLRRRQKNTVSNRCFIDSLHSLKVTHLLSLVVVTTQQCSPSGLLCVGPRYRITRTSKRLVSSSSPVAAPFPTAAGTVVPSGNCHSTLLMSVV